MKPLWQGKAHGLVPPISTFSHPFRVRAPVACRQTYRLTASPTVMTSNCLQTLSRELHFRLFGVQRQAKDGKMSLNRHGKALILRFFSWHKLHQNVKGVGFTRTMAMMPKWPRTPALAVRGVSRNAPLLWRSMTAVLCPNVWLRMDAGWRGLVIFGWVGVVLLWWWQFLLSFF